MMKALRVEQKRAVVQEVDIPERGEEALVRVILSGICNTDIEIARGYAAFTGTIGHEFVGIVEDSPEAAAIGRRVVGEINAGCGRCELCRAGDPRHCPQRTVLGIVGRDGAHAEFLRLPLTNLLPVPDKIPDEHAVFVEPLAAAYGIQERIDLKPSQQVAVIGDGKLGLLCGQVLALTGAHVVSIGKHPEKQRIVERRGVDVTSAKQAAKSGTKFDVIVEASGSSSGFDLALKLLRPRGVLVLKSTFHGRSNIDTARIVVDEISIVGSRCGRFAPAIDLLRKGAVDVDSLISEEYPLADGEHAMERATTKGVLKVLLRP
jgi:threonine dehydrogenase-like Zn-dependent dehydrogenase